MSEKNPARIIDIASVRVACKTCYLRELCLPAGLAEADLDALERVVKRRHTLGKGDHLYRMGDPMRALYAIRAGSVKNIEITEDGRTQVMGFYFAGELLGVDAINGDCHPCEAIALEESEVCEIPFDKLEGLARHVPGLQHQLLRIMSREIVRDEQMLVLLGRMSAEARMAACLLNFYRRYQRLGLSGEGFRLAMPRQDLADYLGVALETVSRLFSRMQDEGLIRVHGRQIRLADVERLQAMVGDRPGKECSALA